MHPILFAHVLSLKQLGYDHEYLVRHSHLFYSIRNEMNRKVATRVSASPRYVILAPTIT